MEARDAFEALIGRRFRNPSLLERALTHRSFSREQAAEHNERFEFLGDAILGFVASERLMERFPRHAEGVLTKIKAQLVSATHLHAVAKDLRLGERLRIGRAEERNGGREKKGLLVDALEALIAAVYLDGGLDAARDLIDQTILRPATLEAAEGRLVTGNAKSALQETLQAHKLPLPTYRVVGENGPPHERLFEVELEIGQLFQARACGATKKAAEQLTALEALERRQEWLPAAAQNTISAT